MKIQINKQDITDQLKKLCQLNGQVVPCDSTYYMTQIDNMKKAAESNQKLLQESTNNCPCTGKESGNIKEKKGFSCGKDKNGYYIYTHRARSKSYESLDKIPMKDIDFIDSTG